MADSPQVLASIKPLHSLSRFIMQGLPQPQLLIADNQSIHDYQLKPSQRRLLANADVIIYASNHLESFLVPLQKNLNNSLFINLSKIDGLRLLKSKSIQPHNQHADDDPHIWLSPFNAQIISRFISQKLTEIDPNNAALYQQNLTLLLDKLKQLEIDISAQLQPIQNQPYLLFHDAFQYFENQFHLSKGLYVTSSADHKMGIKYIRSLKQRIKQSNLHCVYYEPPHIPKLINTLLQGPKIQILPLDPLGVQYTAGIDFYFKHLRHIADKLVSCLNP